MGAHTFLSWLILAYHIWNMMRLLPLKRIWEKGKKVKLNLQLSSIRYVDLWSVENALRDHKIHDSWKECWRLENLDKSLQSNIILNFYWYRCTKFNFKNQFHYLFLLYYISIVFELVNWSTVFFDKTFSYMYALV